MGVLRDKGLISYEEKVCTYWPEFAKNGKENITVADVMRHEAGLDKLDVSLEEEWLQTDMIKKNKVGEVIENTHSFKKPDTDRTYHAMTRDWITNEIFRRVEPQGRTMAEYFEQEIEK